MSRVLSAPRDSLSDGAEFVVWWVPRNVSAIITSILSDRHFSRALRKCGGRDFILCAASFTPACPLGRNINYRASSVAHVSRVTRRHRKHQRSTENSHDNHRFCPDDDPNYLGRLCSWLHLGEEPPPRLSLSLSVSHLHPISSSTTRWLWLITKAIERKLILKSPHKKRKE